MTELIYSLMALGALFVCVIPHEVAHGYVAWKLGDPTAKAAGRLTLNPLPHLDPVGSFLLPSPSSSSGGSPDFQWSSGGPSPSR